MNSIDLSLLRIADETLARYERDFRQKTARGLAHYLPADETARRYLLPRLVRADLELRWDATTAGSDVLAAYLDQFPELNSDDAAISAIAELIRELCQKDSLNFHAAAFRARFPAHAAVFDQLERAEPEAGSTTVDHSASGGTSTGLQIPKGLREKIDKIPAIPGYEVIRVLASGGMGYVLHARDTGLRRDAAIKLPLGRPSEEQRERFLREAQAAAALRHPNICQVFRVDVADDGSPFIAMEFLAGPTLRDRIRERPLTPQQAAALLAPVARAVAYAHEQGIIHRDIKPQNIIVRREKGGELPVLTDFGLAKMLDGGSEVTQSGQVMGSPSYMPPEQAKGETDKVGPLSDVYSLGAVLYQMLTGQAPFLGPVGEVLKKVQTEDPVAPHKLAKNVHRDLETICLKCLEKEPAQRYASATALAEDLERFANGEPILARRASPLQRAGRWARRNRVLVGSAVVLLMIGLGSAYAVKTMASKTGAETELTKTERAINDELGRGGDWTAERLQTVSNAAARLGELDAVRGADATERINDALLKSGKARLQNPTFTDADKAYAAQVVEWLRPRDPKLADELVAAVQKRTAGRDRLFLIEPPTDGPDGKFDVARGGKTQVFANPHRVVFDAPVGRAHIPLHLTSVAARGNAELIVRFAPGWEHLDALGAAVNVPPDDSGGYAFVIRPKLPPRPNHAPATFADARAEEAVIQFQLFRGERLVREHEVAAAKLGAGPLTVTVQRTREQVFGQVNQLPPVKYSDLFALPGGGVFGVVGPKGVSVSRAEGLSHGSAAAASPLERGDELYLNGDYTAALDFYRRQEVASGGGAAGSEARFKVGITLFQLQRNDEAADRLREIYETRNDPFARLAAYYLIAAHVRRKRLDLADEIIDHLSVIDREQGDVLSRLPEDVRNEILKPYRDAAQGLGLLRDKPGRVVKIERLVRAEAVLGIRPEYLGWARLQLIRSLRSSPEPADRDRAAVLLREWLSRDYPPGDSSTTFGVILVAEYGWVMREAGTPQLGLYELDRRVFVEPGVYRPDFYQLLIERARLLVALGRLSDAERDLRDFLTLSPVEQRGPRAVCDANLMLGLLRERRGDAKGAREAWLAGGAAVSLTDPAVLGRSGGGIGLITCVGCQVLSDSLTDADFERLAQNLLKEQLGTFFWDLASKKLKPGDLRSLTAVIRAGVNKPAGREQLWQFAFQTNPFREYAQQIVLFSSTEFARVVVLGGTASPEQDALLTGFVAGALRMYAEDRLRLEHGLPLYGLFQNGWNASNWNGFAKDLDPPLRGPLAYMLGHRYLRQARTNDAVGAFQSAAALAPPGSALKKLAEAELEKLPAKK